MVWSAQQDLADRLLSLDAAELAAEVSAASRDVLGRLDCHFAGVGVSAALDPGTQTGRASPCTGGGRRA